MQVTVQVKSAIQTPGWDVQRAVSAIAADEPEVLSDEALMSLLSAAADQQTIDRLFAEVFRRYNAKVAGWCYRVTKNRERARDLTQEVFLKAFRNMYSFRGESRLSTWLYVITRNHCFNSLKKWKTEPTDSAAEVKANLRATDSAETHLKLERAQSCEIMYRVIGSILTPMELRIMALHYAHELPLAAITRQLMLPNRSGAKAYIVSARRKLKVLLQNRDFSAKSPSAENPRSNRAPRPSERARAAAA